MRELQKTGLFAELHADLPFCTDEDLLERVRAVAEGDSEADMIQDVNNLAVMGRQNTDRHANYGSEFRQNAGKKNARPVAEDTDVDSQAG